MSVLETILLVCSVAYFLFFGWVIACAEGWIRRKDDGLYARAFDCGRDLGRSEGFKQAQQQMTALAFAMSKEYVESQRKAGRDQ